MSSSLLVAVVALLAGALTCAQSSCASTTPGDGALKARSRELTLTWANRAFAGSRVELQQDMLFIVHDDEAGTTKINRAACGRALRLGDKTYQHGIGTNSLCVLRVRLSKPAASLRADIGLDRNVDDSTPASVRFHVRAANSDLFSTPVMRPKDGMRSIEVPLHGATEFDLIVDDGGDGRGWDQGDWADARVILQDGTSHWLDALASRGQVHSELPFTFRYGGHPSAELLKTWRREVKEDQISSTKRQRTITFTDPKTLLEVKAIVTLYTDTPGVDWTLHFTNRGLADTRLIEDVRTLDIQVTPGVGAVSVLHRLNGSAVGINDWMPIDETPTPAKPIQFGSVNGRTAIAASPFFTLDWGDGGVVTGFGWSGEWSASVTRASDGIVRMQAGMKNTHTKLHPGESIRTPRILQVYWEDGTRDDAQNLFRSTMLAHIVPRQDGSPTSAPIVHLSTSFYEMNASTEANTLSHLNSIKGAGFEVFWLDAYWTRDGFPDGMGHYGFPLSLAEPPDRFPHGLKPISDAAHKAGMKFLVWFEPERVAPRTHIAMEHPEWVISPAGDGSGLLNLGNPIAREYMTKYLIAAVRAYGLDWLRIDFNIDPLPFWQYLDHKDPERAGIAEIRYVEGLYRMWDDILAAYPELTIDNCASGGTRIDLETCSRSVPLWRTDDTINPLMALDFNDSALRNQVMSHGLNRYLPFSTSGQMGTSPYLFRSGFNGGIAFAEDCRPKGYPLAELKKAISEAKRIRKYWYGDYFALSTPSASAHDWCVVQYHLPREDAGVVMAFRRHESPYASYVANLHDVEPGGIYAVSWSTSYTRGRSMLLKGSQLQNLKISIDQCPGSILIEYSKVR